MLGVNTDIQICLVKYSLYTYMIQQYHKYIYFPGTECKIAVGSKNPFTTNCKIQILSIEYSDYTLRTRTYSVYIYLNKIPNIKNTCTRYQVPGTWYHYIFIFVFYYVYKCSLCTWYTVYTVIYYILIVGYLVHCFTLFRGLDFRFMMFFGVRTLTPHHRMSDDKWDTNSNAIQYCKHPIGLFSVHGRKQKTIPPLTRASNRIKQRQPA